MHNLFLGTAKHWLKSAWFEAVVLKEHLPLIQERIDSVVLPLHVGRIPSKIMSSFAVFTADQFKTGLTCIPISCYMIVYPVMTLNVGDTLY